MASQIISKLTEEDSLRQERAAVLRLASVGCEITLKDIYADIVVNPA